MWETYGHDGVAVCTRYELLHGALNGLQDDAYLGRVQYGSDHLTDRFNGMEFIFTKELKYAPDCEVRALITSYDPLGSGDRHFDLNNYPQNSVRPQFWCRLSSFRCVISGSLVFVSPTHT
jgi:hypothetical protein